ncbi:MAG: TolC family protein, partial [Bryobacteraceae bacterium]
MGPPRVNGVPAAPPSPNVPWTVPAGAIKPEPLVTAATALAVPPDLEQHIQQLSLADVVDLALRNNPATRASWAQARASADLLGSARGQYYPTVDAAATLSR